MTETYKERLDKCQNEMRTLGTHPITRRTFLAGTGTTLLAGLPGCTNPSRPTETQSPDFVLLDVTATYIHDDLDLDADDELPLVSTPTNADLIILPANTDTATERAIEWLTTPRSIALLGDTAQDTWLTWSTSEEYRDTFGGAGSATANPAPQLIVAIPDNLDVHTYRYSWAQKPTDTQVLEAIEEAMITARNE